MLRAPENRRSTVASSWSSLTGLWSRLLALATLLTSPLRRLARPIITVTPLSTVIILACAYLLVGPVSRSSDIISAALAYGLFSILGVAQGVVILAGLWLRRTVRIGVTAPNEAVYAGTHTRLVVTLSALRVIPGTTLVVDLEFDHPLPVRAQVRVSGSSLSERRIPIDLTFPHRAQWGVKKIRCEVRDYTGLALFAWEIEGRDTVTVAPPQALDVSLPILSSTQRPGDTLVDTTHKQGDPFDIKQYHPSDGMKKILWKAFAKRGELLARHPEASMTPEGYVVIFVAARTADDTTAARAAAYVRTLSDLRLDVIVGCEGIRGRSPATDPRTTEELLIDTAWDSRHATIESLIHDATELLDYCADRGVNVTVKRIVVFCNGERAADADEAEKLTALAEWFSQRGIEPVFCVDSPPLYSAASSRTAQHSALQRFTRLLLVNDPQSNHPLSVDTYRAFLSGCLARQWEVHV